MTGRPRVALLGLLLAGCLQDNPNYCDEQRPCVDGRACETTSRQCVVSVNPADLRLSEGVDLRGRDLAGTGAVSFSAVPMGSPSWEFAGWQLFIGMVGTAPNFPEFTDTVTAMVGAQHKLSTRVFSVSKAAHLGPYEDEAAQAVSRLEARSKSVFSQAETLLPRGVVWIGVIVPRSGPRGRSSDAADGLILQSSHFPFTIERTLTMDGARGNTYNYPVPAPPAGEGWSHVLIHNYSQYPGGFVRGSYAYEFVAVDGTGSGWRVTLPYTIE